MSPAGAMIPAMSDILPADPWYSTLYLEWVRSHAPEWEDEAQTLLTQITRRRGLAQSKPGRFLKEIQRLAHHLPPEHLPWFWDTIGHRMLQHAPRNAAKVHALARKTERIRQLPIDTDYRLGNALLFARAGALASTELRFHREWLAEVLPAQRAHEEFVRLVRAWSASGAAPVADLHLRLRDSVHAAGLGEEEEARLAGEALVAARGTAVPATLLDGAARLLARVPPGNDVRAGIADMFPTGNTDGAAWLRLLRDSGTIAAMAAGEVEPAGSVAGWLTGFAYHYIFIRVGGGGVTRQPLPEELYEALPLLAARLREEGVPVRLHKSRYGHESLDADAADACLALGIPITYPDRRVQLGIWGKRSRRDLTALAADPVLGVRLENTAQTNLRRGTAITRLPQAHGVEENVRHRISALLEEVAHGGLGAAREALSNLDTLLDTPTIAALDGVEEALRELDLSTPLLRVLRAGLPAELCWPAMEDAVAELEQDDGGVVGMTATWPVLTVYGHSTAIAVDRQGRRGACAFTVPEETSIRTVHFVGGDFLVGWSTERIPSGAANKAFWASDPSDVFTPGDALGMMPYSGDLDGGLGYQFATADGGRHDGQRILHAGGREGIGRFEQQMSDGARIWSSEYFSDRHFDNRWAEVDPDTGERQAGSALPEFFTTALPEGMEWSTDELTLTRLPQDVTDSPLGQAEGLSGFRVARSREGNVSLPKLAEHHTLEGADGRHATHTRSQSPNRYRTESPWGIVRMPAGGAELVATQLWAEKNYIKQAVAPCYSTEDQSLMWEVSVSSWRGMGTSPLPEEAPLFPPPAFWHFLRPRDEASSRALREVSEETVRELLVRARAAAAGETQVAVRAALARLLPDVTDPEIVRGVVSAVVRAARLLNHREELSRRAGLVRSRALVGTPEDVADTELIGALEGLVHVPIHHYAGRISVYPATLTAVATDGEFFRGRIDDEVRRLSPPAPPRDWTVLVGGIGAVAWRLVSAHTSEDRRSALAALLRTWAAQPFAEPGTWRRGRASGAELAPLCAAGQATVTTRVATHSRGGNVDYPAPSGGETLVPEASYRFLQPANAPLPSGSEGTTTVTVAHDDAARIAQLLELVEERGPLPLAGDAVEAFMRRTGVRRAVATLVLAGFPERNSSGGNRHSTLSPMERMLRGKPFQASSRVRRQAEEFFGKLGFRGRIRVLAAAIPQDPVELWTAGGAVAAAERMAEVWVELLGSQQLVDEEAAEALERDLNLPDTWLVTLADPAASDTATIDMRCVLATDEHGEVGAYRVTAENHREKFRPLERPYADLASLLVWLLTERPVSDPVTAGATDLHARLRARLDAPELLLPLGFFPGTQSDREIWGRVLDSEAYPVLPASGEWPDNGVESPVVYDNGLVVLNGGRGFDDIFIRPSGFGDPDVVQRTTRACAEHGLDDLLTEISRAGVLYDGGLARMVQRAATTPVPVGCYEADPLRSVPEIVAEAAEELGVSTDAAVLYLQLLTLARPTDRNVRAWNGWKPDRHRRTQAELVERGLVVQDKRSRAGRSVFLPGGWSELKAPELPLEAAKLDAYMTTVLNNRKERSPFSRLLPPAPLHEMFASAWAQRKPCL